MSDRDPMMSDSSGPERNFSPFPLVGDPVASPTTAPPIPRREQPSNVPTKSTRSRLLSGTSSTIALLGGIVTLIGGIAGLLFLFWPSLRPDDPPSAYGAQLSNARVEPGVTLGAYWDRRRDLILAQNADTPEPTDDERNYEGVIVTFESVIEGYERQQMLVRWTLLDAESGRRLADHPELADVSGWPVKHITPTVNRDQNNVELWISIPISPKTFVVRVEIVDPKGVSLATLDTPPFAGALPAPTLTPTSRAITPTAGPNSRGTIAFPTLAPIPTTST